MVFPLFFNKSILCIKMNFVTDNISHFITVRNKNALHFIMQNAMHTIFTKSNMIVLLEVITMSFRIQPDKKESENKTVRFPSDLIARIETAIANHDVTFSSFVLQACEYALEHLDEDSQELEND